MDAKAAIRVLRENLQKSQEEVMDIFNRPQIRFLENRALMTWLEDVPNNPDLDILSLTCREAEGERAG